MSTDSRAIAAGATLLRLTLGGMWVSHAWFKISAFGVAGFAGWLDSLGLPGFMAGPVIALELIGGILILAGFYARYVSIALLPVLAVATWTHLPNGMIFSSANGGWEYPVFLMIASVVQALIGDGALALKSRPLPFAALRPAQG
ncbi:DoxX family protein [Dongia deserti]|uniref:DoxX family protein n=1 Tax=Dongia deserti TaxID=2268030 RepID=UPI000E64B598|nr:DoxX family protein [Dongia deserti]